MRWHDVVGVALIGLSTAIGSIALSGPEELGIPPILFAWIALVVNPVVLAIMKALPRWGEK